HTHSRRLPMSDSSISSLMLSIQFAVPGDSSEESQQQPRWSPSGNVMDQMQAFFSMLMPLLKGMPKDFSPGNQKLFDQLPKPSDGSHHARSPVEGFDSKKPSMHSAPPAPAPAPAPSASTPKPTHAAPPKTPSTSPSGSPGSSAHSVDEAAKRTHPTF